MKAAVIVHLINGDKIEGVTIVATAERAPQDMGTVRRPTRPPYDW
jgi:hypothetical protein